MDAIMTTTILCIIATVAILGGQPWLAILIAAYLYWRKKA